MLKWKQSSTWRGLALVGSSIAAVMGYGHIFSAEITAQGLSLGGAVGAAIPFVVGAYDALRDEFKGQ